MMGDMTGGEIRQALGGPVGSCNGDKSQEVKGNGDSLPSAEAFPTTIPITRKGLLLGVRSLMTLYMLYASEWEVACKPI